MSEAARLAPSAPVRLTQEERRARTRTRILEASLEVLADRGVSGFTTTEVAARAGVSRGAQAHYFRTRDDLILGATEYLMEQGTAEAVAEAARARESSDPIAYFMDDAERFFFSRIYVAMMELLVAARTDETLGRHYLPIVEKWRARINDIWLSVLDEAGIEKERAWLFVQLTNNMMRGLALTALWDRDPTARARIVAGWRRMIRPLLDPDGAQVGAARTRPRKPS